MHNCRTAVAWACLAAVTCNVGRAAEPQWQALQKTLQERLGQFEENRKTIDRQVLADFDRAIVQAGRGRASAASVVDQKLELEKAKADFEAFQSFPESDEYAVMELDYRLKVNRKFLPVGQAIDSLVKYANRSNDPDRLEEAVRIKEEYETKYLGGCDLPDESRWLGTYDRKGRSVIYELAINEVRAGGTFDGHVESNKRLRVHPSYDVKGTRNGAAIEFAMTSRQQGMVTAFTAKGVVSGNRIIANVDQRMQDGEQWKGTLVLTRQ
ncbi:hypothetical protein Pan44_18950 [Caulifigura coniformis]|uniref:Uncharacterized protein n=1 Tax=Caulifigura coniformis TaxID=2527983 RepID=A0A517SCL4_9PLAN|nr:hypothetical protein [Caulifigura coniformis]QDT53869.1 hypothetical protein Pan44_18950 [Caulifigura coniformis]